MFYIFLFAGLLLLFTIPNPLIRIFQFNTQNSVPSSLVPEAPCPPDYEALEKTRGDQLQLKTFPFKCTPTISLPPTSTTNCFVSLSMRDNITGETINAPGTHPNIRLDFTQAGISVCVHSSCSCQVIAGDLIEGRFEVVSSNVNSGRLGEYNSAPLCSTHAGGYTTFSTGSGGNSCRILW